MPALDLESVFDEDTDTISTPESTESEAEELDNEDNDVDENAVIEDDAEDDDEEESEFIELDGKEITLDEIRELQKSEFREQDYTKKSQANADERKSLEQKSRDLDGALEVLSAAEGEIKALLVSDLDDIDMEQLKKDDYSEFQRVRDLREERQGKVDAIKAKAKDLTDKKLAEEHTILVDLLGWTDKAKRDADSQALSEYAKEVGLTDGDMSTLKSAKIMAAVIELAKLKRAPKTAEKKRSKVKVIKSSKNRVKSEPSSSASLEDIVFGV